MDGIKQRPDWSKLWKVFITHDMSLITIITPTLGRDPQIVQRCMACVEAQTFTDWEHLICSDGPAETAIQQLVENQLDSRRKYLFLPKQSGHFGAGVRAKLTPSAGGEFLVYLDDDNVLFPDYLEKMVAALTQNPFAGFAVSRTLHFGPLPEFMGLPPQVITGIPPKRQHIDTIQVMVRKAAILESGWVLNGYFSDGYTYEKLAKNFSYVEVPEVLSAHL